MCSSQAIFDNSIGRYVHTYLEIYQAERARALLAPRTYSQGLCLHVATLRSRRERI